MDTNRNLITVKLDGTRYRGSYALEQEHLVVEAYGLGRKEIGASLIDYTLGEPAEKLATLVFTELVKENVERGHGVNELVAQGSTTQVIFIGANP